MQPRQWWAESVPPGWNRVKVSENLGATPVAPVAHVDTSLLYKFRKTGNLIISDKNKLFLGTRLIIFRNEKKNVFLSER